MICDDCGKKEATWRYHEYSSDVKLCDDCHKVARYLLLTVLAAFYWDGTAPGTRATNWVAYVTTGGSKPLMALLYGGNWCPGSFHAMLVPVDYGIDSFKNEFRMVASTFSHQFHHSSDEIMIKNNRVNGCPSINSDLVVDWEGLSEAASTLSCDD